MHLIEAHSKKSQKTKLREANNPAELQKVLTKLESIQKDFQRSGQKVSLADLIVLGGTAGVEQAIKKAGITNVKVPFNPGRMDASEAQTDAKTFEVLKPEADGFRNFYSDESIMAPIDMLIEKSRLLTLNVPEMTVLIGGLRVLDGNTLGSKNGVFTNKPGTFSNDFFVNLLDMSTKWQKPEKEAGLYEGIDRKTGELRWTATPVDLVFGSYSELRAVAEVYAADKGVEKFAKDFVAAWTKVMNADRFDLKL